MFSLGGAFGLETYADTLEEQRKGGLVMCESSDSGESESDVEAMDEEEDSPSELAKLAGQVREDDTIQYDVLKFPEPKPWLISDGDKFRFAGERIPADLPSFPPHVLLALAAITGVSAIQMAAICFQPCMPFPVHASPLVSFFMNKLPVRKGKPFPVPGEHKVWVHRPVSFLFTCYQLHQMKELTLTGSIPFHPSITEARINVINIEYAHQLKHMEMLQNDLLDELFERARSGTVGAEVIMMEFVDLLQRYSFQYIHLLEYYLYSLLIGPFNTNNAETDIPLEAVLTPTTLFTLPPAHAAAIMPDVVKFFEHKHNSRVEQEAKNTKDGRETVDRSVVETPIRYETIKGKMERNEETYKGFIPLTTLREYFDFLDCEKR